MTIRKIQKKHGNFKCDWCDEKALRRSYGWGAKSCMNHIDELEKIDQYDQRPDYSDASFSLGLH